ncbi:hypothetical protein ACJMK2_012195 [Sinanodonta woodiana]|uniref:Uncharacterized protein n=1 Tax=Sinanodonta woodiana TaxID=1069815 RepID=A0ABD3V7G0_SINWO
MEKKCLAFVKRLSTRLSEGLADKVIEELDQTSIEEAFTGAISSLPKGDLKEALLNNTKLYQEKFLKKLRKRNNAENVSTSSQSEAPASKKYPYNFIRKNRYRISPETFSCLSGEQKCATYGHYLHNLLRFASERRVIHTFVEETEAHKVWLQELNSSSLSGKHWGKDIESLLQVMSGHKNLNSLITVMKILLSKSQKEMDHLVQKKKLKGVSELAERLKKFLIVFHLKKKVSQATNSEPEKAYVNLMSSLLSIFIDMMVLNNRDEERKKKTGRYICGFTNYLLSPWPHSRLDVLLQISVLDEEDSEIIMPFVRSVFESSFKQDNGSSHETYLKHVLAVKFLSQKFQQEMEDIVLVTRGKRAGDEFLDWLQERCPDVLEEMPVNDKKFKGKQITNFLIDEADEEMVSKLLDALTEDTLLSAERIQGEETWKSKQKDEGEETELGAKTDADIFFLDTKGFAKGLIRNTDVQSEDENQEEDEVQLIIEDEDEKENEAEENMEEGSDQSPEGSDIFFMDTKGSKKELDDSNKCETRANVPSPVKSKSARKKRVGEGCQQLDMDNETKIIESQKAKKKCIGIPSPVKSKSAKKKRVGEVDQQLDIDNEAGNIESSTTEKKAIIIPSPVKSKSPKKRVDEIDQELVIANEAENIESPSTKNKCVSIPSPVKSKSAKKRDGGNDQQLDINNAAENIDSPKTKKKRVIISSPVKSPKPKRVGESDQELVVDNEAENIENKPTSPKKRKTGSSDQHIRDQESVLEPEANKYSENTSTMGYVTAGTDSFHTKKENILLVPDLSVFLKSPLCIPSRLRPRHGKEPLNSPNRTNQKDGKEMLGTRQKDKNNKSFAHRVVTVSESESDSELEADAVKPNENVREKTVNRKRSGAVSNKKSPSNTLTLTSKISGSCDADTSKPRNQSFSQSKNSEELQENMTPSSRAQSSKRRVSTLSTTSTRKQSPSATCLRQGNEREDEEREEEDMGDKLVASQKLATPSSIIIINDDESSLDSFTQLTEHESRVSSGKNTNVNTLFFDHSSFLPTTMKEGQTLGQMRRRSSRQRFQDKNLNSESLNKKSFLEGHSEMTTPASLSVSRTTSESSTSSRIPTRSRTRGEKSLVENEGCSGAIQAVDDDPEILFSHIHASQKNQTCDKDFKKSPLKEKSPKKGYSLRKRLEK